ncbi:unnamed protein product [Rotaria magnacalcarata]|uniref:J domain-containing protein n=1 Tax=Rotaria magnacalcarata TaxID=392030 RepID=A0A817ANF8_9BILA|nr:unnamed protein product [Rotaria magnacalcarata]CAF1512289.1 unnamed protein product [Rotaria magnacalcarata]CAF2254143.1 unnamed protein product [Rotaria magnacalcarata]CAF3922892.1 unnamed protein product [Rotaria magnacalcarata]CAF3968499.1 unnamed protein product [Rotaria magnacalcarata]
MATSDRTPYQILEVSEDIDYVKLRRVYREKIHDHLKKKISAINFRRICRAYETLSDFEKRRLYDAKKEWIFELPIDKYTSQQLAAEPDLIRDLKQRLRNANLTKLNAQDPVTGHTTLYTAARAGNLEAVKFLTEQGAEPDLSQRTKSTALHVASFYGHADVVRCLLESGANFEIKNAGNSTAEDESYNADVKNVFAELKQIAYVRAAANELDWFYQNGLTQHQDTEYFSQRQTLLHCASKKGYYDLVHWLVEQRQANMDLVDFNGNTALHLAAYGGHKNIIQYLLDCGCDSTVKNRWGTTAEEEGGMKHGNSITDIFKEIRGRDMFEMARTGVDWWFYYYFDDSLKDTSDTTGISLLYYACRYGHFSVAKWLLEHGANVNIQMKTKPKSTPLHGAKYRGHYLIVELLLEYDADVNIKNDFGTTVFDEEISNEVDNISSNKIQKILLQYQNNLKSDKLIDVHVYENDGEDEEPIVKVKLGLRSKYSDLLAALSSVSGDQYPYFSIARRMLSFKEKEETTIISAVGSARYGFSKFIDTPIRLIGHKTLPNGHANNQPIHQEPKLYLREFNTKLDSQGKTSTFSLKSPLNAKKTVQIGNLMFTFSEGSIKSDIEFKVIALSTPDPETFDIPGCICLFKTEINRPNSELSELPLVSIVNELEARFYTLAQPSPYWFSSHTRQTRLPMLQGIHAFVRHIDIIPNALTLPGDMFIAAALDQPLILRNNPVPCTCLVLREQDSNMFPNIAYHGTNIKVIQFIVRDGLVTPGTLTASGKRVNPPSNHIARDVTAFHVKDFAAAIFLSPSVHYSSDPVYAIPFSHGDLQMIPVLECSVKRNSYDTYPSTVRHYTEHPGDNMNAIEWRVKHPADIVINAILFITTNESISASKLARIAKSS